MVHCVYYYYVTETLGRESSAENFTRSQGRQAYMYCTLPHVVLVLWLLRPSHVTIHTHTHVRMACVHNDKVIGPNHVPGVSVSAAAFAIRRSPAFSVGTYSLHSYRQHGRENFLSFDAVQATANQLVAKFWNVPVRHAAQYSLINKTVDKRELSCC